jgi:enamine deaminase RidA (YjgF/YER057c/UK114 family)
MNRPIDRLHELGYELPRAPAALASYVPTRLVPVGGGQALLYIAGQVPIREAELLTGRVPSEVSVEDAREAARVCALNILAQVDEVAGLDSVVEVVQLTGWVLSDEDFGGQPQVVNGASDLLVEVFGEAGRHTRAVTGAKALPSGVTVEIAAVVLVRAAQPPA